MNFKFYKDEDNTKTIFITIAACEELFLEQTIRSAISLAYNPSRVYFGVFNNILDYNNSKYYDEDSASWISPKENLSLLSNKFFTQNQKIMYVEVITSVPMGVGYGRLNASLLSTEKNHDYFFQIDAHSVFSKNWDKVLIDNYNRIENEIGCEKMVLTSLPGHPWTYDPNNRNIIWSNSKILNENKIKFLDPYDNNYDEIQDHNGIPRITFSGWQGNVFSQENVGVPISFGGAGFDGEYYEETNCVHASFMFGKYSIIREVMHDPQDDFNGDQVNYSLRLLSRGYRIFAVKRPFLSTLNKYTYLDKHNPKLLDPEHNWRSFESQSEAGSRYHAFLRQNSKIRYEDIFSGKYLGYWGADTIDSLNKAKKIMGFEDQ